MPQAVVDPEEVRQFARNLKKFNSDLRDRLTVLNNHLTALGGTWRDQEHKNLLDSLRIIPRASCDSSRTMMFMFGIC